MLLPSLLFYKKRAAPPVSSSPPPLLFSFPHRSPWSSPQPKLHCSPSSSRNFYSSILPLQSSILCATHIHGVSLGLLLPSQEFALLFCLLFTAVKALPYAVKSPSSSHSTAIVDPPATSSPPLDSPLRILHRARALLVRTTPEHRRPLTSPPPVGRVVRRRCLAPSLVLLPPLARSARSARSPLPLYLRSATPFPSFLPLPAPGTPSSRQALSSPPPAAPPSTRSPSLVIPLPP